MRLPKAVQISGKTYTVRKDNAIWGGIASTGKQEIVIGTHKSQSTHRQFETYLHEVAEMVACEQDIRFEARDEELVFVMNHKQFNSFANGIATALFPMIKE